MTATWDEALDFIAERLLKLGRIRAPNRSSSLSDIPKWMRPFAKRLAHSFGSPNYCTESSVCFRASFMAASLNYGGMGKPDIKNCKCLLSWSSNPFHTNTPMVRSLLDARERGMKIIDMGPLLTPMTAHADMHLRFRPGTSGALALSMAHVIIEEGLYDREFVEKYTLGFEEYRDYVRQFPPGTLRGLPAWQRGRSSRLHDFMRRQSLRAFSRARTPQPTTRTVCRTTALSQPSSGSPATTT